MNLNNLFEAANPAQQAAIAIAKKKAGEKPKNKGLTEFAPPGGNNGDSGRWYTDDELADIIGDDWFEDFDVSNDGFNIDAYGEKAKKNLVGYANSWFDDKGYNVNVMGVEHNDVDHDLKWYIVGSFQNDNFAGKDIDEGLGSKLAGLGLAGAMALGSAGANARVTPDGQGSFTGGLKPSATVTAPADNKPAAEAPKGFSKEYLQKAADPNRFGRYMISVEKAQELLKNMQEGVAEGSQRVDSLVTDALKIMKGSDVNDAVRALKTVLGDREYNGRRGHYNFYVRQLMDMYGQQGVTEAGYRNYNDNRTGFGSQAYRADGGANDEDHESDRRREQQVQSGTWYIRLNGKLIKDKQGNPYSFRGKAAANKAALTMQAKLFNQGKEFMLTTNPNDNPQGVAEEVDTGEYDARRPTHKGETTPEQEKKFRDKVRQYGDELEQRQKEKEQGVAEGQQSGYGRGYASYKSLK